MFQVERAPQELSFGRQGESNILSYAFDFSEWAADWPGGMASMTVILPNQTQAWPIPAEQAVVDGTVITLYVQDNLTAKEGRGTLIIHYVAGPNKKRSRLIEFVVEKGHEPAGEAPEHVQDWIDDATSKLGEVYHFIDETIEATESANAAAVRAENGEDERENAEGLRVIAEQGRHDAYELAEAARDGLYDAAESDRDGLFNASQTERTNAYNLRENQRDDAYAAAELIREGAETARETAEGLRDEAEGLREQGETNRGNAYSQAESARDGLYATAESARDGLFEAAETTRNAQTGDAIDRANTIAETLEGIAPLWADVDIDASALPEGASPTASIAQDETGTSISLGIPKGDTGAQGPVGNVMFATFGIIDGDLIVTTPDGYTGPTFSIVNNELEVNI